VPLRPATVVIAALGAALAVLPAAAQPAQPRETLRGEVGPGFSIFLRHQDGRAVTQLDAGEYTIIVDDMSVEHNFHLFGQGVEQSTAVETTGFATWMVTFADAQVYRFQCDPHLTTMRGSFNVGNVPPPPPPPARLLGQVGPRKTISLKNANGSRVSVLVTGTYRITVRDRTKTENFHLTGPGVNRKTRVAAKTTATWTLRFAAGRYTYRSDKTRRLRRSFEVRRPGP
jgi:hypothetical protein